MKGTLTIGRRDAPGLFVEAGERDPSRDFIFRSCPRCRHWWPTSERFNKTGAYALTLLSVTREDFDAHTGLSICPNPRCGLVLSASWDLVASRERQQYAEYDAMHSVVSRDLKSFYNKRTTEIGVESLFSDSTSEDVAYWKRLRQLDQNHGRSVNSVERAKARAAEAMFYADTFLSFLHLTNGIRLYMLEELRRFLSTVKDLKMFRVGNRTTPTESIVAAFILEVLALYPYTVQDAYEHIYPFLQRKDRAGYDITVTEEQFNRLRERTRGWLLVTRNKEK